MQDLEPWRCQRTDRKNARSSNVIIPNEKYNELNMQRAKYDSRGNVEQSQSLYAKSKNDMNVLESRIYIILLLLHLPIVTPLIFQPLPVTFRLLRAATLMSQERRTSSQAAPTTTILVSTMLVQEKVSFLYFSFDYIYIYIT